METVYNFIKITLLGLILGALIVFLLEMNNWTYDIKKTVQHSSVYRDKEYGQETLDKFKSEPPVYNLPNTAKQKI